MNTPKSENVRKLFKRYLGSDITRHWKWSGKTAKAACDELDEVIELRGELVHRGRESFDRKSKVKLIQVRNARNLIWRLVQSTEKGLGTAPVSVPLRKSSG